MGRGPLTLTNMNGGEISPQVYGRTDLESYQTSSAKMQNIIPQITGGFARRTGTRFIAETLDSTAESRLIPFIASEEESYVLEFANNTLRIFTQGGVLLIPSHTFSGGLFVNTTTNEIEVTGHGYRHLDGPFQFTTTNTLPTGISLATDYYVVLPTTLIFADAAITIATDIINLPSHGLSDQAGPYRFSGTSQLPLNLFYDTDYYIIRVDANNIKLSLTPGGAQVDISTLAGGQTHSLTPRPRYKSDFFRISPNADGSSPVDITTQGTGNHTITPVDATVSLAVDTPWDSTQIAALDYAQSSDVMYLVHPEYKIRKLSRISGTGFLLEEVELWDGPWAPENVTSVTISSSTPFTAGQVATLTASSPIFSAKDAGRYFRKSTPSGDTDSGIKWGWGKIFSVSGVEFQDVDIDQHTFSYTAINTTTGEVTITGHLFDDLEGPVRFTVASGLAPTIFSSGVNYWIIKDSANIFRLATSLANAVARIPVTGGTRGFGTFRLTTSVIEIGGHGILQDEGPLTLTTSGSLPNGLSQGVNYYANVLDLNRLQLMDAVAGNIVPINSATGGGLHIINGSAGGTTSQVKCLIKEAFPVATATTVWSLGLYGPATDRGYPAAIGFGEQRLILGGSPGNKNRFDMSQASDIENFAPDDSARGSKEAEILLGGSITGGGADDHIVTDASAIPYTLVSTETQFVKWVTGGASPVILTTGGVWPVTSSRDLGQVAPTDVVARLLSQKSAGDVKPQIVDNEVFYVSRLGKRLLTASYDIETDGTRVNDPSLPAEHLLRNGIKQITYAEEPYSILWIVTTAGELVALVNSSTQEVRAWNRHVLGGSFQGGPPRVESVCSIPDPTSEQDRLYLVVRRTINGSDVRYVEYLEDFFEAGDDENLMLFMDSAPLAFQGAKTTAFGIVSSGVLLSSAVSDPDLDFVAAGFQVGDTVRIRAEGKELNGTVGTLDQVNPQSIRFSPSIGSESGPVEWTVEVVAKTIDGFDHLIGEEIQALGDSAVQGLFTVDGSGQITLDEWCNIVTAGLPYESIFTTLPLQAAYNRELAITTVKYERVAVRFYQSLGCDIGPRETQTQPMYFRRMTDPMNARPALLDGEIVIDPADFGFEEDAQITLRSAYPYPLHVIRIAANVSWGER